MAGSAGASYFPLRAQRGGSSNSASDRGDSYNDVEDGSGYLFMSEPSVSEDGGNSWSTHTSSPRRWGGRSYAWEQRNGNARLLLSRSDIHVPTMPDSSAKNFHDLNGDSADREKSLSDGHDPELEVADDDDFSSEHAGKNVYHLNTKERETSTLPPHSNVSNQNTMTPVNTAKNPDEGSYDIFYTPHSSIKPTRAHGPGVGLGQFMSPDNFLGVGSVEGNSLGMELCGELDAARNPDSDIYDSQVDVTPLIGSRSKKHYVDRDGHTARDLTPALINLKDDQQSKKQFQVPMNRSGKHYSSKDKNELYSHEDYGICYSDHSERRRTTAWIARPPIEQIIASEMTVLNSDTDQADDEGNDESSSGYNSNRKSSEPEKIDGRSARGSSYLPAGNDERLRVGRHHRTRSGDKTAASLMLAGLNGGRNDWIGMMKDELPHPEDNTDDDDEDSCSVKNRDGIFDSSNWSGDHFLGKGESGLMGRKDNARVGVDEVDGTLYSSGKEKSNDPVIALTAQEGNRQNFFGIPNMLNAENRSTSWCSTADQGSRSPRDRRSFLFNLKGPNFHSTSLVFTSTSGSNSSFGEGVCNHIVSGYDGQNNLIQLSPKQASPIAYMPAVERSSSSGSQKTKSSSFSWISRKGRRRRTREKQSAAGENCLHPTLYASQSESGAEDEYEESSAECQTNSSANSSTDGSQKLNFNHGFGSSLSNNSWQRKRKTSSCPSESSGRNESMKGLFRGAVLLESKRDDNTKRIKLKQEGVKRSPSKKELAELYRPFKNDHDINSANQRGDNVEDYPTFICPRCKTRQREFFSVKNAPRQFDTPAGYLALYFAVYVVSGLFIFGLEEGWRPMDCVYFSVITLTTAGLGDLTPSTNSAKIVCSLFIYFGVACIGLLLGSLLASSLDDESKKLANEQLANSCPNCQRLGLIVNPATHSGFESKSVGLLEETPKKHQMKWPMSGSRVPTNNDGKVFFSERDVFHSAARGLQLSDPPKVRRVSPRSNVRFSAKAGSRVQSYGAMDSERLRSAEDEIFKQVLGRGLDLASASHIAVGQGELGELSELWSLSELGCPGKYRMTSDAGSFSGNVPAIVDEESPIISPTFAKLSPTTPLDILNRSSHTRHISMDINFQHRHLGDEGAIFSTRKASVLQARRNSSEAYPTVDESAAFAGNDFASVDAIHRQLPFNPRDGGDDSSSSNLSYDFSCDGEDENLCQLRGFRAAQYVFLTLKQAVMNSILIIAIGSLGFYFIEKLSPVDSFYFTTVLLTTVGYGDIVPHTSEGKMFATIYVLVAGTVLLHNMSMISMIPLELRKQRIEREVLNQFGEHLDDIALRELASGPLIQRLQLAADRLDGLNECTREMFALAMLVRLGRITERDVSATFAAFRRLDRDNDGKLDSKDIIYGEVEKRRKLFKHQASTSVPRSRFSGTQANVEYVVLGKAIENEINPLFQTGVEREEGGIVW